MWGAYLKGQLASMHLRPGEQAAELEGDGGVPWAFVSSPPAAHLTKYTRLTGDMLGARLEGPLSQHSLETSVVSTGLHSHFGTF